LNLQNHQLAEQFEKTVMANGNQKPESGYSGIGFYWYGMPVYSNAMTRYGAMSTASGVAEQQVVDRSAGDRSMNSGLIQNTAAPTASAGGM